MTDMTSYLIADAAEAIDAKIETPLSPLAKTLVITGLALAAWVPVLLPLFLIFRH
jgi:hypothetical protein